MCGRAGTGRARKGRRGMVETIYTHSLAKAGATEGFPFGPDVLVMKVGGKMFALMNLEERPVRVNLKCDPVRAIELRERFHGVMPGWHMNKKHWNTVDAESDVPRDVLLKLIDHSYDLVRKSLPKAVREAL